MIDKEISRALIKLKKHGKKMKMEMNMTNILSELSLEEIDKLLDKDMTFAIGHKTASRIRSSVFRKSRIKR